MIRYYNHNEIDKAKWDKCIREAFNGMIYAYSWYLDIVSPEWDALIENDYERVFPLPVKKRYGIHYIAQPYFTQQLGLFSKSKINPSIVDSFIKAIPGKYRLIELNLNTLNSSNEFAGKIKPQLNHELDLIKDYDFLFKNYSENTRRNVKKATKSGLSVMKNIKPDEIVKLFRDNRGKEFSNLTDDDYSTLLRLIYSCIHKGRAELYGIYSAMNELCAGAIFITNEKKSTFIFSGLSEYGRENRAMFFLIDKFIEEHAHSHLTFDFDGSNDPNLARFYKGFGSTEIKYPRLEINKLPWIVKLGLAFKRR